MAQTTLSSGFTEWERDGLCSEVDRLEGREKRKGKVWGRKTERQGKGWVTGGASVRAREAGPRHHRKGGLPLGCKGFYEDEHSSK